MSSSKSVSSTERAPSPQEILPPPTETEPTTPRDVPTIVIKPPTDTPIALGTRSVKTTGSVRYIDRTRFTNHADLGVLTTDEMDQMWGPGNPGLQTSSSKDSMSPDPFETTPPAPGKPRVDTMEDSLRGLGAVFGSTRSRGRSLKSDSKTMESPVLALRDSASNPITQTPSMDTGSSSLQEEFEALLAKRRNNEVLVEGELAGTENIPLRPLSPRKGSRQHASGGHNKAGSSSGPGRAYPPQDGDQSCQPGPSGTRRRPPQSGGGGSDPPDDKSRRDPPESKENPDQPDGEKTAERWLEMFNPKEEADKPKAESQTSPRTDENQITLVPPPDNTPPDKSSDNAKEEADKPKAESQTNTRTNENQFPPGPPGPPPDNTPPQSTRGGRGWKKFWASLKQKRKAVTGLFHKRKARGPE